MPNCEGFVLGRRRLRLGRFISVATAYNYLDVRACRPNGGIYNFNIVSYIIIVSSQSHQNLRSRPRGSAPRNYESHHRRLCYFRQSSVSAEAHADATLLQRHDVLHGDYAMNQSNESGWWHTRAMELEGGEPEQWS